MRRTKEQAALTRLTILDAAQSLFAKQPYDGVSLDEIAAAAGVKRGAVHFHFDNKPGLVLALVERMLVPVLGSLDAVMVTQDPGRCLRELLHTLVGTLLVPENRGLLRAFTVIDMTDAGGGHRGVLTIEEHAAKHIGQCLRAAADKNLLCAPWTVETAIDVFMAFLRGSLLEWVRSPDGDPDEINALHDTFVAALFVERRAS